MFSTGIASHRLLKYVPISEESVAEDVLLPVSGPVHSTLYSIVFISGLYGGRPTCIISFLSDNAAPRRADIVHEYLTEEDINQVDRPHTVQI